MHKAKSSSSKDGVGFAWSTCGSKPATRVTLKSGCGQIVAWKSKNGGHSVEKFLVYGCESGTIPYHRNTPQMVNIERWLKVYHQWIKIQYYTKEAAAAGKWDGECELPEASKLGNATVPTAQWEATFTSLLLPKTSSSWEILKSFLQLTPSALGLPSTCSVRFVASLRSMFRQELQMGLLLLSDVWILELCHMLRLSTMMGIIGRAHSINSHSVQ